MTPEGLIARLGLEPHPEGGWYRRTWRNQAVAGERPSGSAIYYLLTGAEASRRHRVDATEIWHYYRGAPLELRVEVPDGGGGALVLGPDIEAGECPQIVVPPLAWQAARSLGVYSLVGCTVSPAFDFGGFELADPD